MTGICSSCSRRSSRHCRQAAAARRRRRRCHLHRQRLPAGPRGPFERVCRCPGRCLTCLRCARACFLHPVINYGAGMRRSASRVCRKC
eukprot:6215877-Prymnesium_polylepis.1